MTYLPKVEPLISDPHDTELWSEHKTIQIVGGAKKSLLQQEVNIYIDRNCQLRKNKQGNCFFNPALCVTRKS